MLSVTMLDSCVNKLLEKTAGLRWKAGDCFGYKAVSFSISCAKS